MEIDQPSDHCGNMAEQLEEMRRQLHDLRANAQAQIQPPLNTVDQRERQSHSFDGKFRMDDLRHDVTDLRQRSEDQRRRLSQLEARCWHVVTQRRDSRECYYCHRRGHVRRHCPALKQRHSSRASSSEARKQTYATQRAMLLAEHSKAMLARDKELATLKEKCRCLSQQLKAALDTCAVNSASYEEKTELEKLQLGRKEVECDALKPTVELCGRLDHERHLCVRTVGQTSQGKTLYTGKRNIRYTESSDEGISVSTCDTDDVDEKSREIVELHRHLDRERHQPVRLAGRPRRLLGTQNQSAVVKTRRRCLPCVPTREANIDDTDMSVEAVRDLLVRVLERSRGERSSSTDTLPEETTTSMRTDTTTRVRWVFWWRPTTVSLRDTDTCGVKSAVPFGRRRELRPPRDEISDESTELDEHEEQTGRPVRRTAGQHRNPFREPRSVWR